MADTVTVTEDGRRETVTIQEDGTTVEVGEETVSVVTVGIQGPAGPQGEKGEQGETGTQGPQGETGPAGGVDTVFGRSGDVVAEAGDYSGSQIANDSSLLSGSSMTEAIDGFAQVVGETISTYIPQIASKANAEDVQNALDSKADKSTTPPSTSTSSGNAGTIAWDSNYLYICVATNTWKRVAVSTW